MDSKRKLAIIILISILSGCLIIFSVFAVYSRFITGSIDKNVNTQILDITHAACNVASDNIAHYNTTVETLARNIGSSSLDLSDIDAVKSFIGSYPARSLYKTFSILSLDGMDIVSPSSSAASFIGDQFFSDAVNGKTSFSKAYTLPNTNTNVYYIASPIIKNGKTVAVLCTSISSDDFNNSLSSIFWHGANNMLICDSLGTVISTPDSYLLYSAENVQKFISPAAMQRLQSGIDTAEIGVEKLIGKYVSYYMGYAPIGNSDLRIVMFVNSSQIESNIGGIKGFSLFFMFILFLVFIVFASSLSFTYAKNRSRINKAQLDLEAVISNIPGGVVRFSYDDSLTIKFLNEGLLSLTGYTQDQIRSQLNDSFLLLIHPDDHVNLSKALSSQNTITNTIELDCRVRCSNGTYNWFLFKGKITLDEYQNPTCLCVLTDINETKIAQQELNLNMQRYRIVTAQSDSIIFEYSYVERSTYLSDKWSDKFSGYPDPSYPMCEGANAELVHSDDLNSLTAALVSVQNGEKFVETEARLRSLSGRFIWCRIRASAVFDENGNVAKCVGKIIDIDEQRTESEHLRRKAELDSLSGLYNKGTVELMVEDFLSSEGKDSFHALMILDIDNFKCINDTLGHLVGDTIISDIASRIKSVIRATDICGRIGGDEFVVLLKNTSDESLIVERATQLCAVFRNTICNREISLDISGSIGISLYGKDGYTYNELLDKADTALYQAKKRGKNQFAVYGR